MILRILLESKSQETFVCFDFLKKKGYFETMNNDNTPPVVLSEENKNKNGNNVMKKNDTDVECGEVKLELQQQRQKKGGGSENCCTSCLRNMKSSAYHKEDELWKLKQWVLFFLIVGMFATIFILSFIRDENINSNLFMIVIPIAAYLMYRIVCLSDSTIPGKYTYDF